MTIKLFAPPQHRNCPCRFQIKWRKKVARILVRGKTSFLPSQKRKERKLWNRNSEIEKIESRWLFLLPYQTETKWEKVKKNEEEFVVWSVYIKTWEAREMRNREMKRLIHTQSYFQKFKPTSRAKLRNFYGSQHLLTRCVCAIVCVTFWSLKEANRIEKKMANTSRSYKNMWTIREKYEEEEERIIINIDRFTALLLFIAYSPLVSILIDLSYQCILGRGKKLTIER